MASQALQVRTGAVIGSSGGVGSIDVSFNESSRKNTAIIGEIGSGKTSVMRQMILNDIENGVGVMLLDPHRELAREVIAMTPASRHEDVIYVSLASMYQFQNTVSFNPMEIHTEQEALIKASSVVDGLKHYFDDTWGYRKESVIRELVNLVMHSDVPCRYFDIIRILFDDDHRAEIVKRCKNKQVCDFWNEVYPNLPANGSRAIYDKLHNIINTPAISAMFDHAESTINMKDIIENGRILVVDLGSGVIPVVLEFIGSLLINMFTAENRIRLDLSRNKDCPFNVYIDEGQFFNSDSISTLLTTCSQCSQKVTISFSDPSSKLSYIINDLWKYFDCAVTFKVRPDMATVISRDNPEMTEGIVGLSYHKFCIITKSSDKFEAIGVTKSIDISPVWQKLAKRSLGRYGRPVDFDGNAISG